jgi:hypothetical protein
MTRRALVLSGAAALMTSTSGSAAMADRTLVIDALDRPAPEATVGTRWEYVSDRVMGGVSTGGLEREEVAGRPAMRLTGSVSLENNGGFVQMALDLSPSGQGIDARGYEALEIDVFGNGETYNVHLRTADVVRPWQSYRSRFEAAREWRTVKLPLHAFSPHRLDAPLDLSTLRRIGIVAIGEAFEADVAVGGLRLVA